MKKPAALIPALTHASTAARDCSGVMPLRISLRTPLSPDSMPKNTRLQPARFFDGSRKLDRSPVVEGEEVVRHPDVVVAKARHLLHLGDDRPRGPGPEEVAEDRLVAEVTSER